MDQSSPKYTSIEGWQQLTDLGRRHTYDLLAAGKLRAVKSGTRTLIDVEHGLKYLASLPPAVIKRQDRSKNAA
jgi:excisionase family DNA binding protein